MKIESLHILIPSNGGAVRHEIMTALIKLILQTPRLGITGVEICTLTNAAPIAAARDRLAEIFLAGSCSHSLWIDDDMAPSWQNLVRLVELAAQHGLDFLSATYCTRSLEQAPVYAPLDGGEVRNGLQPAEYVGFGCCLVSRSVFESVAPRCNSCKAVHMDGTRESARGFFQPPSMDRLGEGEDVSFCRRAREAGVSVWVDPANVVSHVGRAFFPLRLPQPVRVAA